MTILKSQIGDVIFLCVFEYGKMPEDGFQKMV